MGAGVNLVVAASGSNYWPGAVGVIIGSLHRGALLEFSMPLRSQAL